MSRIGKKPISLPQGVAVSKENGKVVVRGPKGELALDLPPEVDVEIETREVRVFPKWETAKTGVVRAKWGTIRALLAAKVEGVTKGFEKKLEIEGVGYRVQVEDASLVLHVGFNNPVKLGIPKGLSVSVEKNSITVSGIDKQLVGQFAAEVRSVRPVEPYKGKGIRYQGEHVVRKAGKKVVAAK